MRGSKESIITEFDKKLQDKLEEYGKAFRLDELNDANDRSTLMILLKTEIMIDDLQEQIQTLIDDSAVENATNIKKLADLLRDATGTITKLQQTLSIDRRTRKTEETASVADYIRTLKRDAHDFMERRIIKTFCPDCKIMVGRIYPVHEHTSFTVSFQCSQCNKFIRARRDERDVLFDVKDKDWRRKYKAEIIQPKKGYEPLEDDDLYLSDDEPVVVEDITSGIQHTVEEGLELIGDDV